MKPLEGRVAIVTGASRGIGSEIAHRLGALGAKIIINFVRNKDQAEGVASAINTAQGHGTAMAVQADVSQQLEVIQLFDKAQEIFGRVHILVNNAGIIDSSCSSIAECSLQQWETAFNVNCKGPFLMCKEAAKRLVRGGGGRIINISGTLVATLVPGFGVYAASKAAMETFTQILARELRGTAITANCVAPGPIATDMFYSVRSDESVKTIAAAPPLERLGECKDVASVIGFLAFDEGEWINGQILRVNGGLA
ncbi:hypothetical protein SUGI_0319890 [Cryptomeria japonica]|uniref:short-chain type dehydrogenase/reductase n=1 Tax=Cryptomeria japonica TaxID=3369 RepID=UPI002408E48A|nr:short-chain type dehydrogenase/reductase [Cryptomeria japonica]GLJ18116.1 hypothetical protein SUGI_0319890 [Cryptomeria japonica]